MFCSSSGPEGSHGQYLPFVATCVFIHRCVCCVQDSYRGHFGDPPENFSSSIKVSLPLSVLAMSLLYAWPSAPVVHNPTLSQPPKTSHFPLWVLSFLGLRDLAVIYPMSLTVSCNTMNDGCECCLLAVFIKQLQRDCWRSQVCIPPWSCYCGVVMDLLLS